MESFIGKAIDLVCEYTVVPVGRQLQYVFCYKSRVEEMKDAINKLQNDKEIVDREKTAALHNMRLIHNKTEDWLEAVTKAQDEVSSLIITNEQQIMSGCCIIGGHVLNPIARHKLGRKATKKKQAIEDLLRERPQHDHDISYAPPPPGIVDHQVTSDAAAADKRQTDDGIFRSSRWNQIMEEIMVALKDERNNVVGLYGMGGVGKSTMINVVYDQVKKQCMFDEVVRVEVKVKPEIWRIQGEIAFQLGLKFESECSLGIRADLLRERLLKAEKKKRVLIILDDLWVKLDLQEVGIPLSGNDQVHIKLFLTSREEHLLSYKMGARELIHLNVLSDADALRMFKFVVGVGVEGVNDDKVTEIARKCSGLPIVIEATAKALKDRAIDEWDKILKCLDNDDVLEKLKVSYDYLPSKESKNLFLMCGISRGPNIQVRDLLKYTFGLRLYNRKDSSTLVAATTKLEKLLSGLEAASMLLKSDDNRYVKIHDRMRELAVKIVEKDHPEWAYDVTLSDNCCELTDASELKLLLSCCEGDAVKLRDSFLKDMEKLNVLEFTSLHMRVALSLPSSKTELDHLRNLGTLCLHNCCLNDISMIWELKGLQILSFQGSDIRKLPLQLQGLTMLKMLDLSDCEELTQIEPNVLGSLTKLEELNMENSFNDWEIDREDDVPPNNARLVELKNMSHLSNVRIHIPSTSMLPKDGQLFSSKVSNYRIMVGGSGYDRDFSDTYIKFSRVLMLNLDEYSSDIVWMDWVQTTLQTVEVLYLSGFEDGKCESISEVCTKGFDCLKHLRITYCPSFQFIISSNGDSFTNLEWLFLDSLESLEKLCDGLSRHEERFNKLKALRVNNCKKLTHLFDFSLLKSRLSSQLEEITVSNCPEMQCIVVGESDNDCDVATFSNLQKLNFRSLRKFSSFCVAGPSSNVLFTGKKVAFPCLESLIIGGLDELEHIWHPTDPPAELGNLQLLYLEKCSKLVRVINCNVLMRVQRHLEYLSITDCHNVKEVFDVDDEIITSYCTDDDDEHDVVLFSRLKNLKLCNMHGIVMMMIMKGGRSMTTMFPNIEWLDVLYCPHLRYVLCCSLPTTAGVRGGGYHSLKEIKIKECNKMETVVMLSMVDQESQPAATTTATTGRDAHHHQNYDVVTYSYSSLQTISIDGCQQLRTFCQDLCSQQDSVVDFLPFFSQKEIFPCLESLHLGGLSDKLVKIWPHEVPHQTSFNMLNKVTIQKCAELAVVFPSTLTPHLENLTELQVQSCDQLMQIVHGCGCGGGNSSSRVDEEESMKIMFTFPHLRKLSLKGLQKLDRFYSSSTTCGFQLPSLEYLYIWHCRGVKTLFSHDSDKDMVGAFFRSYDKQLATPNLMFIDMNGLENLTKIWKGEKPQGLFLKLKNLRLRGCSYSCTNLQSLFSVGVAASVPCWNVLTKLTVECCDGLEYLLSPVGATSLVHLTRLYILNCKNIKEVVVADVEEEEAAAVVNASNEENQGGGIIIRRDRDHRHIPDMITFRYLKLLQLLNLPKLEKFSSKLLNFPSLKHLDIQECPNMKTFSSGSLTTSTQKFGDLNSFVQKMYEEAMEFKLAPMYSGLRDFL